MFYIATSKYLTVDTNRHCNKVPHSLIPNLLVSICFCFGARVDLNRFNHSPIVSLIKAPVPNSDRRVRRLSATVRSYSMDLQQGNLHHQQEQQHSRFKIDLARVANKSAGPEPRW